MLAGKIAAITGPAHGIGRATAIMLARHGADLALLDRDAAALADVAAEIVSLGRRALPVAGDLTDRAHIKSSFAHIRDELGPVDILVNNVGQSARERAAAFRDFDPGLSDFLVRLCLQVTMDCTQEVIGAMQDRNSGKIVNIASDSAYTGSKSAAPYAAAKAGVIGFTRSLAREVARHRITVNAIAPGWIRTRATDLLPAAYVEQAIAETPMGFLGHPDDIANAVLFFASDMSRYATGQTLIVNGGRWMN
jgi:NAD(P)-dependent dehydrogenase (short-subunit alcohol dehydrogenase family)